jgi:biofilm PGA synthesis N-glycosyltransferase PgaC
MTEPLPTYAAITPVRDEIDNLPILATAMLTQTHRPIEWLIVDDGSTDGTWELAQSLAAEHDWINVVKGPPHGSGGYAAPVIRAFNAGREALRERPEITVKLDADLFLAPHYFEWVAEAFARAPRAGIVGGVIYSHDGVRWVPEPESHYMVRGGTKAYRTDCLDDVGGLRPAMGWDGVDEYGARARGWEVHVLTELTVLHYRRVGAKLGFRRSRWEEGVGAHYMGYRGEFFLMRALYRMFVSDPPVIGGLVMIGGFLSARLRGLPTIDDESAVAELRREQAERMRSMLRLGGATERPGLPDGGPAFWRRRRSKVPDEIGGHELPDYSVVSPVRNEAELLPRTAESLISQSHPPTQWVIVENGSTDDTLAVARAYADEYDWITVVDAGPDLGKGYATPPVRAFNIGREHLREQPTITAKLDGDLFLPPHYFRWVAQAFVRDPQAGIVGGVNLAHYGARWAPEPEAHHNARGNNKAYRTSCLDEIGGLRPLMGWDGVDEYGARARGWHVHVLSELLVLHYRRIGDKLGWRTSRWGEGEGAYYMGYRTDFLILRALYRMVVAYPPVFGGLTMMLAFFRSKLARAPQFEDMAARRLLHDEQVARMRVAPWHARSAAMRPLPDGGPAFWLRSAFSSRRAYAARRGPSGG